MDVFENRLSHGLKRYAQSGETGPDLEAYILAAAAKRRRMAWVRWAACAAAVALIALSGALTFPRWAVAAQGWPVVGPVVNAFIVRDANLKSVYDAGMLKGVLAEASDGPVTFRVLGVAADRAQTMVLYQIIGLTETPGLDLWWNRPKDDLWSRLTREDRYTDPVKLTASLSTAHGAFIGDVGNPTVTQFGVFGTVVLPAVPETGSDLFLNADIQGHLLAVRLPVSRTEADRLTREIPLGQTVEIGGIAYTVDTVFETPSATAVRVKVTKPEFRGLVSEPTYEYALRLENRITKERSILAFPDGEFIHYVFPRVDLPARITVRTDVKGVPGQLIWPLEKGAVQELNGIPVTLTDWMFRDGQLLLEWTFAARGERIVSFGDFEALTAAGSAYPVQFVSGGWSGHPNEGPTMLYRFQLPNDVHPVAIRANSLGEVVEGPWVFEVAP
ncbi:MAG TPA: DUF4179 domain-containing protein [Symbiobacteriaceae bacterium]|nr:DUF4179 domain-containing protein [Symbiobacteriaceae bacterium]